MADSLFDNRYRYDYIYPRGRSGETLRAVDTRDGDRPVVVKRPAPNDAPPIRGGQEVSIVNERKALQKLSGHPVMTALLGGGQFFVGGTPHQYIVMERATGQTVAELVTELAARDARLPELEMLVIVDALLDLLNAAHNADVVYNDVDAKHLFWDREQYRLKVIDWGNAVFLEGEDVTPQGVGRQSDVYQVGELLYFLLTGGARADVPRDAGEDFLLDFRRDGERLSPRLKSIVSRAAHPNPRLRYGRISDLRRDLNEYRLPLERERDLLVGRVSERLRRTLSKDDLRGLLATLEPALAADPGYPLARRAQEEVEGRLSELSLAADLDAVRIYMESGAWGRAADLLAELQPRARGDTRALIDLLSESAALLAQTPDAPVQDAMALLFRRDYTRAAHLLVTRGGETALLLAERISAHVPDVVLLRPNLYRLELALNQAFGDGVRGSAEPRALLREIDAALERTSAAAGMAALRDGFRAVVDQLAALSTLCEPLPGERVPWDALDRATNAAMTLADTMHVIGRQATSSPRDALGALDASKAVDPLNPAWDGVAKLLDALYELLQSYQTYIPAADASDLEAWLRESRRDLLPFTERLFDDLLVGMVEGLELAAHAWTTYGAAVVAGSRTTAVVALTQASDAVSTLSPTLSGWLNQLRTVIGSTSYIERHALHGALGRALADGWEAFDRGRLPDAERLGQQAYEAARSEPERFAASRLRGVAGIARDWVERSGISSARTTQAALVAIEDLFTAEETATRENFAAQMPGKDTYLRGMQKGVVEMYARSSTAGPRLLFVQSVLLGTLDALDGVLDDAGFWREVAVRALGEAGARHALTRALDEFIARRRDINAATALLNSLTNGMAMGSLDSARRQLEDNPQARLLAGGIMSVRELDAALRDWADGEFRSAGIRLENAINAVNETEQTAQTTLTGYRGWLMELQRAAAELHTVNRQMKQVIERRPAEPADVVRTAHLKAADVTQQLLGERSAATLKQWRDTYEAFLSVYTDPALRRTAKLNRFTDLFKAMFIDRHPAYPLYRHWYDVTERAPEFPAPPTDDPTPHVTEADLLTPADLRASRYSADAPDGERLSLRERLRRVPRAVWIALPLVLALGIGALLVSGALGEQARLADAATQTATHDAANATATGRAVQRVETATAAAIAALTGLPLSATPPTVTLPAAATLPDFVTPTLRPSPTVTPIDVRNPTLPVSGPSATATPSPTPTDTPTLTWTPSATHTPTDTPTATLPPQGLQGELDLFPLLNGAGFDPEIFVRGLEIGTTYWRLGRGADIGADVIRIVVPADALETAFGNNAASRIRRMEVDLLLATYNPPLLLDDEVYFGALLQSAGDAALVAGMQVELDSANVVNLARVAPDGVTVFNQRTVNSVIMRVRLERNTANGNVSVFVNGDQVGGDVALGSADDLLLPVLYVKDGGVIVHVTRWTVTLR